jgi:hypothetical protein
VAVDAGRDAVPSATPAVHLGLVGRPDGGGTDTDRGQDLRASTQGERLRLLRLRALKACELIVEDVRGLHAYGHLVYADGRRRRTSLLLDTLERVWRQP